MSLIVGSGMIARSFSNINLSLPTLIFASGVSNSKENNALEFDREREMLEASIVGNPDLHVIYFSTTSVYGGHASDYIRHKLQMERIVLKRASSFHIFRLPQVVGFVKNETLVSFFVRSILSEVDLSIQVNARRNLIDVVDVVRIASLFINKQVGYNSIIDVAASHDASVFDIAVEISHLLQSKVCIKVVDGGERYNADIGMQLNLLGLDDYIFSSGYWRSVLRRYVPLYEGLVD